MFNGTNQPTTYDFYFVNPVNSTSRFVFQVNLSTSTSTVTDGNLLFTVTWTDGTPNLVSLSKNGSSVTAWGNGEGNSQNQYLSFSMVDDSTLRATTKGNYKWYIGPTSYFTYTTTIKLIVS